MVKIGLDAMGGDNGVLSTVPGAMRAVAQNKNIEVVLFGDEEKIKPLLINNERISIVHTSKVIDMGEHDPVRAIRNNRDSSLCLAMSYAKEGKVDALVTAGPTQCVVVGAHLIIRKLQEMDRIALCPIIPNLDGRGRLILDVGANVELRPEHIVEIATFASVVSKEVLKVNNPKVGLLNIGSEEGKGRGIDKEYYEALKNCCHIDFYGNIEPFEILDSPVDVIVTDGFTGNIAMKTLEGTAKMMGTMLKQEIKKSIGGKIGALFMKKNLKRFKKRMDSSEVGGAMIFGISVPTVKAHGNSNDIAIASAISQVYQMKEKNIIGKVVSKLPKRD